MTPAAVREAFGAQFAGAARFLNSPTYDLPPRFLVEALHDCIGRWQTGTMDVLSFAARTARGISVTELPADELVRSAADFDVVAVSLVQSATGAALDTGALQRGVAGTGTLTAST